MNSNLAKSEAAQASYPFPFASAITWNPSAVYSPYLPTALGAAGAYLNPGTPITLSATVCQETEGRRMVLNVWYSTTHSI